MRNLALMAGHATAVPLLSGDLGTEQTIEAVREQVDAALRDPYIRALAGRIASQARAYDDTAQAQAVYNWVLRNIRFIKDPTGKETISSARWTLTHGFGDCDDINAILLPSLLGAIGLHTRLVTIASNPTQPQLFSHVYAEVWLNGRWVPVDAARPGTFFGSAPSHYFRKRVWSLSDSSYQDVQGLSGVYARPSNLGFDWGAFSNVLTQGFKGVTDVISTWRAPRTSLVPGSSFQFPATNYAAAAAPAPASTGISSNTLLWGGLILGGAFLLARMGKQ